MVFRRLTRPIIHTLLICIIFVGAYILRQYTDLIPGLQKRVIINGRELSLYACLSSGIFVFFGIIKKRYPLFSIPHYPRPTFWKIWLYRWTTSTFIAYFGRWTIFPGGISRLIILWTTLFVAILIPIIEYWLLKRCYKKNYNILFLYDTEDNLNQIISHWHKREDVSYESQKVSELTNCRIKGLLDFQNSQTRKPANQRTHIICIWSLPKKYIEDVFDATRGKDIGFYHIADWFFLQDIVYTPATINGILAFQYKASTLDEWALVIKRVTDIVVSFFSLILLAPVFAIVAIAIKLDTKWPVFFRQTRVGKASRAFKMYKFRSMVADAEARKGYLAQKNERNWPLFKITNDPRVTRVGRFLRKTSLDELPQLWNVLIGTMSLIGPRPHLAKEIEHYEPRQKRLLSIKPGISGYAQIHGRDELSFDDEAKYDLYYIQHWSLWLDLYTILMTVKIVLKGR